ncbi:MAG: hypothetical protein K2L98_04375 [Bacilli bacterium]|nr:hypothetical protein [Bacilli bacterium]
MKRISELYKIVNEIANMDISFILDDIIGHFVDPDIPINIDFDNFQIDIDTPYGKMHLSLVTGVNGINQELTLKRTVSDTFCEEYKLNLNRHDENFLSLDGKTIELRSRGFIINLIEKNYSSSDLTNDSEKNREKYEQGTISVDGIDSVVKIQEVYPNKELKKVYGKKVSNDPSHEEIFNKLGNIKSDFVLHNIYPQYINTLHMSRPADSSDKSTIFIDTRINGYDRSWVYPMKPNVNAVGRAFKIYQGIIDQDNYNDAIRLINSEKFQMGFAYEDYKDGVESVSKIIEDLIGSSTISHIREYSAEVRNIANEYYNHVKYNPFLFDDYSGAPSDKKRELEKNEYIKQILLSNRE